MKKLTIKEINKEIGRLEKLKIEEETKMEIELIDYIREALKLYQEDIKLSITIDKIVIEFYSEYYGQYKDVTSEIFRRLYDKGVFKIN